MERIRPAGEYVLVKRLDKVKSEGGLWLPPREYQPQESRLAEVLATGPGRWSNKGERIPTGVKPGDIVVIPPVFTGMEKSKGGPNSLLQSGQLLLKASELQAVAHG